jgi:DNA-binding NarL/FixJ family response regulator
MSNDKASAIMIVTDHGAVRTLLRQWLRIGLPECRIIEAGSGAQALALLSVEAPSVVVVDMDAHFSSGMEATRQIKASQPLVKVILLADHGEPEHLSAAARARASGYLLKWAMWDQLIPLLKKFLDEGTHRRRWALTRSAPAWLPGELYPEPVLPEPEEHTG